MNNAANSIDVGQWQQDPRLAKLINSAFSPQGMLPQNPQGALSYMPEVPESLGIPSYDGISGGMTQMVSPYGDGRVQVPQQTPQLVRPTPAIARVLAPPPDKMAAVQGNTPGYGFNPARSPMNRIDASQFIAPPKPLGQSVPESLPLGMSTSFGDRGSRRTPRPAAG